MPLFGKKESFSAPRPSVPPKSLGGMFKESLFGSRPTAPKPEQKPQPGSTGLFGKEEYRTQVQMREFARKAPYEPMPGTAKKLGKQERVALVQELEQRAKGAGQTFGLSEKTYRERILPQMRKEKYQLHIAGKVKEEKALENRMRQYERWMKGA